MRGGGGTCLPVERGLSSPRLGRTLRGLESPRSNGSLLIPRPPLHYN